jgi:hypothetical protein
LPGRRVKRDADHCRSALFLADGDRVEPQASSALAIFFLNLFLGWTLIGWIIAFIWSWTGNTEANFYRLEAGAIGPTGPIAQRRSNSLWLVLILILVAIVLLDKRRDFRDVRSFDFTFPHQIRL